MLASRYDPGTLPRRGLILQSRDLELLKAVLKYRVVTSDHIHALLFSDRSRRVVQTRLRLLFEHRLLNRLYVPVVLTASQLRRRVSHQPLYTIAAKGLQLLRDGATSNERLSLRRTAPQYSASTVLHHLVVTDCLVSLVVALRTHPDVEVFSTATEAELWPPALRYKREQRQVRLIVPDGALILRNRGTSDIATFYLEVVRADVSGGNRRLQEKLARYAAWNHERLFTRVYGHERVRAVLIATTSDDRAEHFRRLAGNLTHGRNLFWFGGYEEKEESGRCRSAFTSERIMTLEWRTAERGAVTLLDAAKPASQD